METLTIKLDTEKAKMYQPYALPGVQIIGTVSGSRIGPTGALGYIKQTGIFVAVNCGSMRQLTRMEASGLDKYVQA